MSGGRRLPPPAARGVEGRERRAGARATAPRGLHNHNLYAENLVKSHANLMDKASASVSSYDLLNFYYLQNILDILGVILLFV